MRLHLVLALGLAALTCVVYAPVHGYFFVNYDDNVYVVDNPHVAQGLSLNNVAWSLTAFELGNWHPLTLMSHMLDVQLFGLNPSGHHLVNLGLHVANALLLFWLLTISTSRPWPSALVAALFAVHPVNVQTVAWISERKSLLSTLFWFAALIAHVSYRRKPGGTRYALVVFFAGMALAAKPMAVTLPLTIVLLDYWPLAASPRGLRYLRELAPLLAMATACGVLTLLAQSAANAIQPVASYSFPVRLGNALVSYVWYLKTMLWPAGLAAYYPHPMSALSATRVALAAMVFLAICAIVLAKGRQFTPLTTGWWWYVGTLLPVAGLIQVGSQAYADRYAYVPLVGIFIVVVWLLVRSIETRPEPWRRAAAVACVGWIAVLSFVTRSQLPYWHDSVALFRRAIEVVPDNAIAQNNLGMALVAQNNVTEALAHFRAAVEITPQDTDALSNLGNALRTLGRPAEALDPYERALALAPADASIHYNLATALVDLRRIADAETHLREALRLNPSYNKARMLLERIQRLEAQRPQ